MTVPALDEGFSGHCSRLRDAHQLEDGRSHVGELSVLHFFYACIDYDELYGVQ